MAAGFVAYNATQRLRGRCGCLPEGRLITELIYHMEREAANAA